MYESFFGLRTRPFAVAPNADALVELAPVTEAAERLNRCIRDGNGIAVLTAAAGRGKTQLCLALAQQWSSDFTVAMLPNASHPTRRGLLQAMLTELGNSARPLTEAELRYDLQVVAEQTHRDSAGLVVIFDEADRYSDRLLSEIRQLTNLLIDGKPLIRVMLAAREELEVRLAESAEAGIDDRIGAFATLPRLTLQESIEYLAGRVDRAGGELTNLFDLQAIHMICRAGGGTPRCINQLADHSLLLGFVAEQKPVPVALVREALDDLKRLPLQWVGESLEESEPQPEQRRGEKPAAAEQPPARTAAPAPSASAERPWKELPALSGGVIEVGSDGFVSSFAGLREMGHEELPHSHAFAQFAAEAETGADELAMSGESLSEDLEAGESETGESETGESETGEPEMGRPEMGEPVYHKGDSSYHPVLEDLSVPGSVPTEETAGSGLWKRSGAAADSGRRARKREDRWWFAPAATVKIPPKPVTRSTAPVETLSDRYAVLDAESQRERWEANWAERERQVEQEIEDTVEHFSALTDPNIVPLEEDLLGLEEERDFPAESAAGFAEAADRRDEGSVLETGRGRTAACEKEGARSSDVARHRDMARHRETAPQERPGQVLPQEVPTVDPLAILDRIEPLVAAELEHDGPASDLAPEGSDLSQAIEQALASIGLKPTPRMTIDQLLSVLQQAGDDQSSEGAKSGGAKSGGPSAEALQPGMPNEPHFAATPDRFATLFSDLRKRRTESRS